MNDIMIYASKDSKVILNGIVFRVPARRLQTFQIYINYYYYNFYPNKTIKKKLSDNRP